MLGTCFSVVLRVISSFAIILLKGESWLVNFNCVFVAWWLFFFIS